MTEREKELEELVRKINKKEFNEIEFIELLNIAEKNKRGKYHLNLDDFIIAIQQAGYTKKHFPVEKLEAWLREEKMTYTFLEVLDKIAELKGEG
jgi:molybdenum cofactor biosynthesis enzyme MoaA